MYIMQHNKLEIINEIHAMFNLMLLQVLFEELHLDSKLEGAGRLQKTSVTRETSTSESVLQQLQDFHPLPAIVLEYRQVAYHISINLFL